MTMLDSMLDEAVKKYREPPDLDAMLNQAVRSYQGEPLAYEPSPGLGATTDQPNLEGFVPAPERIPDAMPELLKRRPELQSLAKPPKPTALDVPNYLRTMGHLTGAEAKTLRVSAGKQTASKQFQMLRE